MSYPLKCLYLWIASAVVISPAWAATLAKIESIESAMGHKTIMLLKGIQLREARVGDEVYAGERIRTEEGTKAILVYADGSKVTVLPKTDLEIEALDKNRVQSSFLRSGNIQGEVKKETAVAEAPKGTSSAVNPGAPLVAPKKKLHFFIKTKTATMGVRGTQFVAAFSEAAGLAQFHTLEGTIEVGKSASSLLSGTGTPVEAGQFVQATPEGISEAKAFNRSRFMDSLSSVNSSTNSSASSAVNSASSTVNQATTREPELPDTRPAQPRLPEPPKKEPPPPSKAEEEKKAEEAQRERPHIHLVNFGLGFMVAESPKFAPPPGSAQGNETRGIYRAFQIHWTPIVPLPFVSFLALRGGFGVNLARDGSLGNNFLIRELQVFLTFNLLKPLFIEVGGGHQDWASEGVNGGTMTVRAGISMGENAKFNRIYFGVTEFNGGMDRIAEGHAGIGIQLF